MSTAKDRASAQPRVVQAPAGTVLRPMPDGAYVPVARAENGYPFPTGREFFNFIFDNMARPLVSAGGDYIGTLLTAPMWDYTPTVNGAYMMAQQMMQQMRDPSFLRFMQSLVRPAGGGAGTPKQPGTTTPANPAKDPAKDSTKPASPDSNGPISQTPLERYLHSRSSRASRNPYTESHQYANEIDREHLVPPVDANGTAVPTDERLNAADLDRLDRQIGMRNSFMDAVSDVLNARADGAFGGAGGMYEAFPPVYQAPIITGGYGRNTIDLRDRNARSNVNIPRDRWW